MQPARLLPALLLAATLCLILPATRPASAQPAEDTTTQPPPRPADRPAECFEPVRRSEGWAWQWRFDARPLADLPGRVPTTPDAVTAWADFDRPLTLDAMEGGESVVPIYLVNRTDRPLVIHVDAHGLLLEALIDGAWVRAEPWNPSIDSVRRRRVPADAYIVLPGSMPVDAEPDTIPATVRYRRLGDVELTTNTGPGAYRAADQAAATSDVYAITHEWDAPALIEAIEADVHDTFLAGRVLGRRFPDDAERWLAANPPHAFYIHGIPNVQTAMRHGLIESGQHDAQALLALTRGRADNEAGIAASQLARQHPDAALDWLRDQLDAPERPAGQDAVSVTRVIHALLRRGRTADELVLLACVDTRLKVPAYLPVTCIELAEQHPAAALDAASEVASFAAERREQLARQLIGHALAHEDTSNATVLAFASGERSIPGVDLSEAVAWELFHRDPNAARALLDEWGDNALPEASDAMRTALRFWVRD